MPKPGPRTSYKYSEEFKATAVKLSLLPGVAIEDVAAELKACTSAQTDSGSVECGHQSEGYGSSGP